MWHFVMGYNKVANNDEQLQTLYKWSTNEGVYVDHIHHPCGLSPSHDKIHIMSNTYDFI